MKPEKIANRDCRTYVQNRHAFEGSNLYAEHRLVGSYPLSSRHYTVYSYGYHYPMFIHVPDVGWFENEDKYPMPSRTGYSSSTERQRSQAHPHTDTFKLSTGAMHFLDTHGYRRFVQQYVLTGEMA
jgi:hypothetical protein